MHLILGHTPGGISGYWGKLAMSGAHPPVAVAVVGCGHWGKNLVRNFRELGALAAVVDSNPGLASDLAARHGVPVLSWAEVLKNAEIPAVVIATPAVRHAELCRQALDAGKHVFVEKPLALAADEGAELAARTADGGQILMVGHLLQYHPAFLRLQDLVTEGRLGRIQYIYSNRLNLGKIRREENVFWSFAPHDVSMILALAGEMPERVLATGACYLHKTIADTTTTHLAFPNGVNAHIHVSWLHPFKEQKLVVVGDKGMASFDDGQPWASKLLVYPHVIHWRNGMPEPERAEAEAILLEEAEPRRLECRHFLDCVATGSRPRTDAAEGQRVLQMLTTAEASMTTGRSVTLQAEASPGAAAVERLPSAWVHPSAEVDDGCSLGSGTKVWHFSHVLKGSRIGSDCVLGQNVMVGPEVIVGDRCKIQNNVSLYKGVTLEDGVFCGPSCVFTNVNTPRAEIERKDEFRETRVGRGATIGANATIVCGHDIGDYAFIAAGAVVTSNVPAFALMAGVPARRIGWVGHAGEQLGPDLVCPRDGRRYHETAPETLEEVVEGRPLAKAARR